MTKNGHCRVLIICAHRPNRSPSQRYRFEQYLPFLESHGYRFTFSPLLSAKDDSVFYRHGHLFSKAFVLLKSIKKRRGDLRRLSGFDIIFIQREASFFGDNFFEKKAFKSGVPVIFDFDDSIWLADTSAANKSWEWLKRPGKFFDNVRNADLVVAGNEFLATKARFYNPNTVIIPTTIDTALHRPLGIAKPENVITIGWSGSLTTVKHFQLMLPVLKRLKGEFGPKLQFRVLGAQLKYDLPSLHCSQWSAENEVQELNHFDIGIMPLPDDEWANGKCGLKGLSYMACGIPAVMSDVGVNRQIIKDGENGFLARSENEWYDVLKQLINDQELRKRIGENGRKTVVENYSVQANKEKYLEIFRRFEKKENGNAPI